MGSPSKMFAWGEANKFGYRQSGLGKTKPTVAKPNYLFKIIWGPQARCLLGVERENLVVDNEGLQKAIPRSTHRIFSLVPLPHPHIIFKNHII